MNTVRRQLTLFLTGAMSAEIEAVRLVLDPVQAGLIPAHVTLCREDELAMVPDEELRSRLTRGGLKPVTLHFGPPEVFSGHGVMRKCIGGEPEFQALRVYVIGSCQVRRHEPHLTLAHPRNPRSKGNALSNARSLPEVVAVTFSTVSLIEQDGGQPWRTLASFELGG